MNQSAMRAYSAEVLGTFLLVFCGCGSALFAGAKIGVLGVSLSFGLTLLFLIYSIGPVSGCHVNPAVTLCLSLSGRFPKKDVLYYIVGQLMGAAIAGYCLYIIAKGGHGFDLSKGFATNGFAHHSPSGYSLLSCLMAELIGTSILLYVILCSTSKQAPQGFAGLYIGISLVVIHLFCIPISNASINFARSFGVAVVEGGIAASQLWLFAATNIFAAVFANVFFHVTHPKE